MTGYTGKDFNLLFSKMSEGVAIHELIFDSAGKPVDYRILDVNPSFETLTSIPKSKAAGARASEIYGTGTAPFLEIYSRASSSGKPESFETYFPPMEKYFSISVVSMHHGVFATIFNDITELKKAANRTEQLNQFLLALRNVNQLITHVKRDPQRLIDEITRTLVQSCNYSHVWMVLLNRDHQATAVTSSSPSEYWDKLNQEFKKDNIPPCAKDAIEKGKTVVVSAISDYCTHCPLARSEITKLVAPLVHDNKLWGVIAVDIASGAFIGEEELSLFDEMAGDIAFALSDIENEEARIRTEKALAESEIRYHSLFNNSNDAIYVHIEGITGRFIDVNDRACQLLGYSREELLEMCPNDINDPDYFSRMPENPESLLKDGKGVFEMVHVAKDGRRIPVELSTGPLTLGGVSLYMTIARDLTERKKTEAELKNLSKFPEENPNPVVRVAEDGTLLYANPASSPVIEFFGASTGEKVRDDLGTMVKAVLGGQTPDRLEIKWQDKIYRFVLAPISESRYVNFYGEDITKRRKSEKALAESESRFRSLFEHMINGFTYCQMIFEGDNPVDFIYIQVNEAFPVLTGLDNVTGKKVSEVIPGIRESDPILFERYGRVALTGIPERFETYVEALKMWFEIAVYSPAKGYFVAVFDVITERKKAEAELVRFNRLYDVLSQVNQAVVRANDSASFLDTTCDIMADRGGFDLAWIGQLKPDSKSIIPISAAGKARDYLDGIDVIADDSPKGRGPVGMSIRHKAPYIIENFMTDKRAAYWNNRARAFHFGGVGAFPIFVNGDIWGALGVYSSTVGYFGDKEVKLLEEAAGDIGFALQNIERERLRIAAEFRIQAAADEWMTTFDSIKDMVAIVDQDHIIRRVNRAFSDMLNAAPGDLLGQHCYKVIHCMNQPHPSCPHARTLISRKAESSEYFDKKLKKWVEASSSPIFDDDGALVGSVHIIKDISARKRAEEEKQLLRDKAEIASRLATVGEMAAGIAHEINNPLTGVIGFSEMLMDQDVTPEIKEQLQIINDGSKRVKDIVKRMLTFARQSKPMKSRIDIHELIENTLEIRGYVLKTANIEVARDYGQDLPWITVDPGQLQQVFLNLIVNAEYAMKQNQGIKGILTVSTRKKADKMVLSFSDNGCGMSKETVGKLFQPFFTTKNPGEGTGLGLSVSRSIILEHGGEIQVESKPGSGSTFTVELPINAEPEVIEETAPEDSGIPTSNTKARVMVIDDEPAVRSLIEKILVREGHSVQNIENPNDVLEILKETAFDVILLDIRLPGISGIELYGDIILIHPELKEKVIFITGDTADANVREFIANHRANWITKPFDRATFLKKFNEVLLRK
ncbi:PAS domain S-box-containing protein [Dehalogenimonas formicexedens]|uniref:histidine kinase n=1 Tax=Dehalogenimonas formicexedens TaxID=1839801 RepID=A0A1P8F8Y7_9CHLR|nr:PAS domain S-box protein [Dehalogenimonas formicexedens]APV44903.1 PAS domain S-box-containing protein [Dehalogenimonas formicexedens]